MCNNIESDTKVKQVLALLNQNCYEPEMWNIALKLNVKEIDLLKDYANQLHFIAQYAWENSEVIK